MFFKFPVLQKALAHPVKILKRICMTYLIIYVKASQFVSYQYNFVQVKSPFSHSSSIIKSVRIVSQYWSSLGSFSVCKYDFLMFFPSLMFPRITIRSALYERDRRLNC